MSPRTAIPGAKTAFVRGGRTELRFSLARLLAGMAVLALLFGAGTSFLPGASDFAVALGGLNVCALSVAILCKVMGGSLGRTFLFGAIFYAWGLACLASTQLWNLTIVTRWWLAGPGIAYTLWLWLGPQRETTTTIEAVSGRPERR